MNANLIIPPYDMNESILEYFGQYGLSPFLILTPFLKVPSGLSKEEFFNASDHNREYYSTESVFEKSKAVKKLVMSWVSKI